MAHEVSITVEVDGEFLLIPSIDPASGKKLDEGEATRRAIMGTLPIIGTFKSPEDAKVFAQKRSKAFIQAVGGPRLKK